MMGERNLNTSQSGYDHLKYSIKKFQSRVANEGGISGVSEFKIPQSKSAI